VNRVCIWFTQNFIICGSSFFDKSYYICRRKKHSNVKFYCVLKKEWKCEAPFVKKKRKENVKHQIDALHCIIEDSDDPTFKGPRFIILRYYREQDKLDEGVCFQTLVFC